jgi:predicted transcriptional regulator
MSVSRRAPRRIALELLNCLDQKEGRATKWDLIKILGNEAQFNSWVRDFLVKDHFVEETTESRHYFYRKTESGELFHRLLKNGVVIEALLRVSGKRLRRF